MNCKHCSAPFEGRGTSARYCSAGCGRKARQARHYAKNTDAIRQASARYRERHLTRAILARVKCRAKAQGIAFNLTSEDICVPDTCPVLGVPLSVNHGRKGYHPRSPSVDRIVPSLGYISGNVRVISARANLLKNDATVAELRAVLSDLENLHRDFRL